MKRLLLISGMFAAVLLLGCLNNAKRERTRFVLSRLADEARMRVIATRRLPRDIDSLVSELVFDRNSLLSFPGIEKGHDPWGRKVLLLVEDNGVLTFRSFGENGSDDDGGKDDIDYSIDCSKFLQVK